MAREKEKSQCLRGEQGITNPLGKRLYTLKEAAHYLGRSVWSLRELIWSNALPFVRPQGSRKIYIDVGDLDGFIEKNKDFYL